MVSKGVMRAEGLTKIYGRIVALKDLDLAVEKGLCVGYLGPNGAGKTTTIKIFTNLIKATSGKAYINGFDVSLETKKALADVGAIVETPEFYPYLTPFETLIYLGKVRGMGGGFLVSRVKEVLDIVKLLDWRDELIGKFSHGMKQRLAIASTLLHDPSILILDEPTSGLDPRGMAEVRELIKELKRLDKTIFMSSHLLYEVQEVADKVVLINKGSLLRYVDVEEVAELFKPDHVIIESLEKLSKKQLDLIAGIDLVEEINQTSDRHVIVSFQGEDAERAELLDKVRELGIKVLSYKPTASALEGMYLKLITESK